MDRDIIDAKDLEAMTGTPAATWRWWSYNDRGPASFKIGHRRVWRRSVVEAWLAEQEASAS